jgi:hypothetical protein
MQPATSVPLPSTTAPSTAVASVAPGKPAATTTRALWLAAFVLTGLAVVVRVLSLRGSVTARLHETGMLNEVHDRRLEAIAINTGIWLAVLISLLTLALYYSVAALMERRLFPASRVVNGRLRFGLFFLVAFLMTVPVQAFSAALGVTSPKTTVYFYAYVLVVGVAAPFVFRDRWRNLTGGGIARPFICSLVLAGLSVVL